MIPLFDSDIFDRLRRHLNYLLAFLFIVYSKYMPACECAHAFVCDYKVIKNLLVFLFDTVTVYVGVCMCAYKPNGFHTKKTLGNLKAFAHIFRIGQSRQWCISASVGFLNKTKQSKTKQKNELGLINFLNDCNVVSG